MNIPTIWMLCIGMVAWVSGISTTYSTGEVSVREIHVQQPVETIIETAAKEPEDAGLVAIGTVLTRTRSVKNTASRPVALKIVRSTCSCLRPNIGKSQLAPGESTTIDLRVVVSGGVGEQRHFVEIQATTDEPEGAAPRTQLIRSSITFTPDRSVEWAPMQGVYFSVAGTSFARTVYIARLTAGDLDLSEPRCTVPDLRATLLGVLPENKYVQRLDVRGIFQSPGLYQGSVGVKTSSMSIPRVDVPLTVRVLPSLRATPDGLVVTHRDPGTFQQTFLIESRVGADPAMSVIAPKDGEHFRIVSCSPMRQGKAEIVVAIERGTVKNASLLEDVRIADASGAELLRIPLVFLRP